MSGAVPLTQPATAKVLNSLVSAQLKRRISIDTACCCEVDKNALAFPNVTPAKQKQRLQESRLDEEVANLNLL